MKELVQRGGSKMIAPTLAPLVQSGDIFVLFLPAENEVSSLRQHQLRLQAIFGGHFEVPHLTCQRFGVADEALVPRLTAQLRSQLVSMRPLPLTAAGVQVLSRGGRSVLKWQVPLTDEGDATHRGDGGYLVQAHKGICRYVRSAGRPGVTALRDIQDLDRDPGRTGLTFPCHLFTARVVQISRQISPREFAILDSFPLGAEPRPKKMDWEGGVPA